MTQKIYRVAKRDSLTQGLYAHWWCQDVVNLYDMQGRHPAPADDSALRSAWTSAGRGVTGSDNMDLRYGFASLEQLKFWIFSDEMRQEIAREGFVIHVLEASETYVGDTQATYHPDTAQFIEILELTEV